MASLNRGIYLPSDTEIRLNNKLFETESGSLLLTIRPDSPGVTPAANLEQTLLSGEYVDLVMVHNSGNLGEDLTYSLQIKSNGTTPFNATISGLTYGTEITVGGTYIKNSGSLSLYTSSGESDSYQNTSTFTGVTVSADSEFSSDTPADIGLSGFDGYVGKLATYSSAFSGTDMKSLVQSPATWPTSGSLGGSLVHLFDTSTLLGASETNTTRPESHTLSFGNPGTGGGYIYIDGVGVYIPASMTTGTQVAAEVFKVLSAHPTYKSNVEKQEIALYLDTGSTSTTAFTIAGIEIPAASSMEDLLSNVKDALEGDEDFMGSDPDARTVVNYGSAAGTLVVTFAGADQDIDPLTVESPASSNASATVRTVQDYSSIGQGRDISLNGNEVTIKVQSADGTMPDGITFDGSAANVNITYVGGAPSTPSIPSIFTLNRDPVSEVQRISITQASGTAAGTLQINDSEGAEVVSFSVDSADSVLTIATDLKNALVEEARSAGSIILTADLDGDSVLVTFDPVGDNELLSASSDVTNAVVSQVTEFGSNTRGESQTIVFGDNGAVAGSIVVDGVSINVAANAKGPSIAAEARKALVTAQDSEYSLPEIQTLVVKKGSDADGGDVTIDGHDITVTAGGTSMVVADEIASAFSTLIVAGSVTGIMGVEAIGSSVVFTFARDEEDADELTIDDNFDDTGVKFDAIRVTQPWNPDGQRKTTVSGNELTIQFNPKEGDQAPITFDPGASATVTASVILDHEAWSFGATATGYEGGTNTQVNTGGQTVASNALYLELDEVTGALGNYNVLARVLLDPAYKNALGGLAESVSFELAYSGSAIPGEPTVTAANGESSVMAEQGNIKVSWINDGVGLTDFSEEIATIEFQALPSLLASNQFTFTNVNINGYEMTDGQALGSDSTSSLYYTSAFDDYLNTERFEVTDTLTNALDLATGIGGQLIGYYANPTVNNAQLTLSFVKLMDVDETDASLATEDKMIVIDVLNGVNGATGATLKIELPSNAENATFARSDRATELGMTSVSHTQNGRTLEIELTGATGGASIGDSLGQVSLNLLGAFDKTHEFVVSPGATVTTASGTQTANLTKGLYFGYTETSSEDLTRGEWTASDIPKGSFSHFAVGTSPTQSDTVINAADALNILKLSTGYLLDWQYPADGSDPPANTVVPIGAYVGADLDYSGKVNAADALMALKFATGTWAGDDPVHWEFIDGNTSGLSITNAYPSILKKGLSISGDTAISDTPEFTISAVLVGNLTLPSDDVF